jgi:hypothetical protein
MRLFTRPFTALSDNFATRLRANTADRRWIRSRAFLSTLTGRRKKPRGPGIRSCHRTAGRSCTDEYKTPRCTPGRTRRWQCPRCSFRGHTRSQSACRKTPSKRQPPRRCPMRIDRLQRKVHQCSFRPLRRRPHRPNTRAREPQEDPSIVSRCFADPSPTRRCASATLANATVQIPKANSIRNPPNSQVSLTTPTGIPCLTLFPTALTRWRRGVVESRRSTSRPRRPRSR